MARSNTIVVRVLGNTKNLSRSLVKASRDIGTLNERLNRGLARGFRVAGIAAAGFGAAAVGAGAVGAAALIGMTGAVVGLGVAFAAQSKKVQKAWTGTWEHIKDSMQGIVEPLIKPLVKGAETARKAFDALAPTLKNLMKDVGPLITDVMAQMVPLAKTLGPLLTEAFKAGAPVMKAFVAGLIPLFNGFTGFFKELKGSTFADFTTALMTGIGGLLPSLGRLLNALTPLGTALLNILLPAIGRFADYLADKVVPAAEDLHEWISKNEEKVKGLAKAIAGAVLAFKGISIITTVTGLLGTLLSPIGLVALAIAGLAAGFAYLWNNSETFRTKVTAAFNAVKAKVTELYETYWPKIQAAFDTLKAWWDTNGPSIVSTVKTTFNDMWKSAGPVVEELKATIVAAFDLIKMNVTNTVTIIKAVWNSIGPSILPLFKALWDAVMTTLKGALQIIRGVIQTVTSLIKGDWSGVWNGIKTIFQGVWNTIKGIISAQMANARAIILAGTGAIKGIWTAAWNTMKTFLSNTWSGIKSGAQSGINALMSLVSGIKGRVTGALSSAGSWLYQTGKNLIQGFLNGIKAMAGSVASAAASVAKGAISAVKNVLRVKSPSRVFMQIGKYVGQGLVIGIEGMSKQVNTAGAGLAQAVARGFEAPQLSMDARLAGAGAGSTNIRFEVIVPPTADKASIGREIQGALDEWKRVNGR